MTSDGRDRDAGNRTWVPAIRRSADLRLRTRPVLENVGSSKIIFHQYRYRYYCYYYYHQTAPAPGPKPQTTDDGNRVSTSVVKSRDRSLVKV